MGNVKIEVLVISENVVRIFSYLNLPSYSGFGLQQGYHPAGSGVVVAKGTQ